MRALLAIVVVALLGALAWWCLRNATVPATPDHGLASGSRALVAAPPPAGNTVAPPIAERQLVDDDAELDAAEEDRRPKISIDGTVIVLDAEGEEHAHENGTLGATFWHQMGNVSSGTPARPITVEEGWFTLDAPIGDRVQFDWLRLGGRNACISDDDRIEVVDGDSIELRARFEPGLTLYVVDEETRDDLEAVTIILASEERWSEGRSHELPHPGPMPKNAASILTTRSPVELLAPSFADGVHWTDPLWIGAAGHAWTRLEPDFRKGGDEVVALARAAGLEVTIHGELALRPPRLLDVLREEEEEADRPAPWDEFETEEGPKLRVRAPQDAGYGSDPDARGAVLFETAASAPSKMHIDGLRPGDCVVAVEWDGAWPMGAPTVAGKTEVRLAIGETRHCTIEFPPTRVQPKLVPFQGTIVVPKGWDRDDLHLSITAIDSSGEWQDGPILLAPRRWSIDPADDGGDRFDAGPIPPGRYELRVAAAGCVQQLDVGAAGVVAAVLRLPPPAHLTLHLIDDATGAPLALDTVEWRWSDVTSYARELPLRFVPALGVHRLDARSGKGSPDPCDRRWVLAEERPLTLRTGDNDITCRLRAACGIVLELFDGATRVHWDDFVTHTPRTTPSVEDVPDLEADRRPFHPDDFAPARRPSLLGPGALRSFEADVEGRVCFQLDTPGLWHVTLPVFKGYEPLASFDVDVPAREFVTRKIELVRRRRR